MPGRGRPFQANSPSLCTWKRSSACHLAIDHLDHALLHQGDRRGRTWLVAVGAGLLRRWSTPVDIAGGWMGSRPTRGWSKCGLCCGVESSCDVSLSRVVAVPGPSTGSIGFPIHYLRERPHFDPLWIPAFAGMTREGARPSPPLANDFTNAQGRTGYGRHVRADGGYPMELRLTGVGIEPRAARSTETMQRHLQTGPIRFVEPFESLRPCFQRERIGCHEAETQTAPRMLRQRRSILCRR